MHNVVRRRAESFVGAFYLGECFMTRLHLGEREIIHPIAGSFAPGDNLMQMIHLSQKASGQIPRARKERGPLDNPLVGPHPAKVERAADFSYQGGKKPSLVLPFKQFNGGFVHHITDFRQIVVKSVQNRFWRAALVESRIVAIDGGLSRRKTVIFKGANAETPLAALFALARMPRWFWHNGLWRSLDFLFRSLIFVGLSDKTPDLPQNRQNRLICAHASGHWLWEQIVIRPRKAVRLPDNRGLSRTPSLPDVRNEVSYVPAETGRIKVRSPLGDYALPGRYVGGTWVVKAPQPRPFSQKDPTPRSFAREAPVCRVSLRDWVAGR